MPNFFKKCHLNSKKCFVLFQTKRTNSYIIRSYQQQVTLTNCLFIKLGVRIKLFQPTATKQSCLKHYHALGTHNLD